MKAQPRSTGIIFVDKGSLVIAVRPDKGGLVIAIRPGSKQQLSGSPEAVAGKSRGEGASRWYQTAVGSS